MVHSTDFRDAYGRDPKDGERVLLVVAALGGIFAAAYDEDIDRWRMLEPPYGSPGGIREYTLTGERVRFIPELYLGRDGPMRRVEGCGDVEGLRRWEPDGRTERLHVGRFRFPDGGTEFMEVRAVDDQDAQQHLHGFRAFMRDRYRPGSRLPHLTVRVQDVPSEWVHRLNSSGRSTMLATLW